MFKNVHHGACICPGDRRERSPGQGRWSRDQCWSGPPTARLQTCSCTALGHILRPNSKEKKERARVGTCNFRELAFEACCVCVARAGQLLSARVDSLWVRRRPQDRANRSPNVASRAGLAPCVHERNDRGQWLVERRAGGAGRASKGEASAKKWHGGRR